MGAEKAGLVEKDIITKIDGIEIKTFSDLTGYIESKRPGEVVIVEYFRDGKAKKTEVTLEVINQANFLRMTLENLSVEEKSNLNIKFGLKVIDSGDYLYEIEPNATLLRINDKNLNSIEDLRQFDLDNLKSMEYLSPEGDKERISFRQRYP